MTSFINNKKFNNKRVIIRCDLNVPIKDNKIQDETRIIESLKTIKYVLETADKVIILSHLGRINKKEDIKNNSLKIVCERLSELLNTKISFAKYDENIKDKIENNKIIMFENTRYFDIDNKKESNNDDILSKFFASFGDVFINDAFGTCHRSNASNVGISKYLPSYLGFLIEKEIKMLENIKNNPKRPFIAIMGGAKVKDKILLIKNLIQKSDKLIITGGMIYTFLKAKNYEIGKSIVDNESIEFCKEILENYSEKIVLPIDVVVSKEFSDNNKKNIKYIEKISNDDIGMDVGNKTIDLYKSILTDASTIFFNGPCGVFEFKNYSKGTNLLCEILSNVKGKVIIGGGDSASAAKKSGYYFENISTGGGAALEYIQGNKLPGLYLGE